MSTGATATAAPPRTQPQPPRPAPAPDLVRIRAGALSGHEATWLESAGRRRFGGGVDLEAGRVRLHDGSVVAIPLGDLERFV